MIFHESGSFPGVPGTFSGVQVTLDADGQPIVEPLAQHPFFEPALPEEEPAPSTRAKKRTSPQVTTQQAGEAATPAPGEEAS